MTYKRLKTVTMQLEEHIEKNPNVDDETLSRLELLRDRLIGFISIEGPEDETTVSAEDLASVTEIVVREIAEFQVDHPEFSQKLDAVMAHLARVGI